MQRAMPLTPSGETIEKLRRLATALQGNPRMRRAAEAALKAMGLPEPLPQTTPKGRSGSDSAPKPAR